MVSQHKSFPGVWVSIRSRSAGVMLSSQAQNTRYAWVFAGFDFLAIRLKVSASAAAFRDRSSRRPAL